MKANMYITGAENGSGKSIIALSIMEMLAGSSPSIGFFRPIVKSHATPDNLVSLFKSRYNLPFDYDAMIGCSMDEAKTFIAADKYNDLLKKILVKYKALQAQCDQVLCVGTDFTGAPSALEFDFNADVANNLGCVILPVVRGAKRSEADIITAATTFKQSLQDRLCDFSALLINRVNAKHLTSIKKMLHEMGEHTHPIYVIPEEPSLAMPTMADITDALNATCIYGDQNTQNLIVKNYKVAAMQLPDFLTHIEEGSLIITPGDRADIVIGSVLSHPSTNYPQIAGILLTGDLTLPSQLKMLIEGLGKPPMSILSVSTDTFTTAMNVSAVTTTLSVNNERKLAVALGTVETHIGLEALNQLAVETRTTRVTPLMFEYDIFYRARSQKCHIVLPEGVEERILRAAEILLTRNVVDITLLGNEKEVKSRSEELGLNLSAINIVDPNNSELRHEFARVYYDLRKHKGISQDMAFDIMSDVSYFGTMMVHLGYADGMVSGAVHTTQHTIRPAFEIIKTKPDASIVSSVFFMCLEDRVLVYGDCAINPNPDAKQLSAIAISSAETALAFGIDAKIAMLSYSTGSSGKGAAVEKVIEATKIANRHRPDLKIEGPIQYDAAVDINVAKTKLPGSEVAGTATVFIFPDLNTGNNTYKAVQRSANAVAIGPILQGLNKPVNDLSRGCTVTDIVNTVAITAIQAQQLA